MNWIATYVDETQIHQFDNTGNESMFGEIDMSKLQKFTVEDFEQSVTVCPNTGEYEINGQQFQYNNFSDDEYLELVYFRRCRQIIGSGATVVGREYYQFVGLRNVGKANKVRSRQLLIQISKENGVKIHTK